MADAHAELIDEILSFVQEHEDQYLADFEIEDLTEFDRRAFAAGLLPGVRSPRSGERSSNAGFGYLQIPRQDRDDELIVFASTTGQIEGQITGQGCQRPVRDLLK